ncbi:MAG: hypothetical protein IPK99_11810 [Flavobacteriales bacterium]|nr:hypothetical protein [Flavobacteriales bacterium]
MVLIDGKFYSIFSMLFGIGFGFFLAKGNDGLLRFYRRMFILLIIGWLHLRYLWNGDILFLYAVLGLLLPLFRAAWGSHLAHHCDCASAHAHRHRHGEGDDG